MTLRANVLSLAAALASAFALAACNSGQTPQAVVPVAASSVVQLPEGAGCSGAIARYRAILDNDLVMGHVEKGVYERIRVEIGAAETACAAGRDGQAVALVRASKARHGYPG